MASGKKPPLIDFNPSQPGVWTDELDDPHQSVRKHFSLPFVVYVGSDLNCGCGFRNYMFQQGGWPESYLTESPDFEPEEGTQKNHGELIAYLSEKFSGDALVELYGCWDGEENQAREAVEEICLAQIGDARFHFKSRALYRVALDVAGPSKKSR